LIRTSTRGWARTQAAIRPISGSLPTAMQPAVQSVAVLRVEGAGEDEPAGRSVDAETDGWDFTGAVRLDSWRES
jgi:hypothetical protein